MSLTKKDMENLKDVFVTKEEFHSLEAKMNSSFEQVIQGQDKIIKELETAREDRIFALAKDRELENRIEKLETVVFK